MSGATSFRALRGAISVDADEPELILSATRELLHQMVELNALEPEQVVSVIFTTTPDLTSAFPACAARELGWHDAALLCMSEIPVPGALPRCVRVLMHVEVDAAAARGRHLYLGAAASLRPDIAGPGGSPSEAPPRDVARPDASAAARAPSPRLPRSRSSRLETS